jgi:hypothetical protein
MILLHVLHHDLARYARECMEFETSVKDPTHKRVYGIRR